MLFKLFICLILTQCLLWYYIPNIVGIFHVGNVYVHITCTLTLLARITGLLPLDVILLILWRLGC